MKTNYYLIVFLTQILSINLFAYDFKANDIYYKILSEEDCTLSVTSGEKSNDAPYNFYYGGIVTIPEIVPFHGHNYKVIEIDDDAFITCINVSYVILPSTIRRIGKEAFQLCQNLSSISLPEGLTSIGDAAFSSCEKLESIVLPQSLTDIGVKPFAGCDNLKVTIADNNPVFAIKNDLLINKTRDEIVMSLPQTSGDVVLSKDVKSIHSYAFSDSKNITSVTVNEGIKRIENYTFASSRIQRIELPSSVISIGDYAFSGCSYLYDITLSSQILSIGDYAFQFCTNLPLIDLPLKIESIGKYTFYECKRLKRATLPDNIKIIGEGAFENCEVLENVVFPISLEKIDKCAYKGCNIRSIIIPEKVTEIGDFAFMLAWGDQGSGAVTIIGNNIHIGKYAFYTEHDKSVKIYSDNPPIIEEMSFGNYWGDPNEHNDVYPMTIHVKKGSLAKYKEANGWDLYSIIEDLEEEPTAKMDKTDYFIQKGKVGQAALIIKPDAVSNVFVKWKSGNPDMLFVDEKSGQYLGLEEGSTSIIAEITASYAGEIITLSAIAMVTITSPDAIHVQKRISPTVKTSFNIDGTYFNKRDSRIIVVQLDDGSIKKYIR